MKSFVVLSFVFALGGCGMAYFSPEVTSGPRPDGSVVRVIPLTAESVLAANRGTYSPRNLPPVFYTSAGRAGRAPDKTALPEPVYRADGRPAPPETRLPPDIPHRPYRIGIGDRLLLAMPAGGGSSEQLAGLLAAETRRQGYTVQDDGAISIPDAGRVALAGKTLEEAEAAVFGTLVDAGITPAFSLEIAEFNSRKVSVGGAVRQPLVVPVTLSSLTLDQAVAAAGGFQDLGDLDYASIRLYRAGVLYQIPLRRYLSEAGLQKTRLVARDSIFVDRNFELDRAAAYFEQQIQLSELRLSARATALDALETEIALRRGSLSEQRANFADRLQMDAVDRDYVYLVGEVGDQARFPLPFGRRATLADALYEGGDGFRNRTANPQQIYVLRAAPDPAEFGAVTAWNLDATNAANFVLATRMELRPNDIVFVAQQPITKWNRVLTQLGPGLVNSSVAGAVN